MLAVVTKRTLRAYLSKRNKDVLGVIPQCFGVELGGMLCNGVYLPVFVFKG